MKPILKLFLRLSHPRSTATSGFTLIEMLAVVIIVGILAAMSAPSWVAFSNRQRVNKANDRLLTAFQEARRDAKETKIPQRLAFRNNNGNLEYSITRVDVAVDAIKNRTAAWKPLLSGASDGKRSGILFACSTVTTTPMTDTGVGTLPNQINNPASCTVIPNQTATALPSFVFDSTGGLPLNSGTGFAMMIGLNRSPNTTNNSQLIPGSRRCVYIETLLGSTRTEKGAQCPASS